MYLLLRVEHKQKNSSNTFRIRIFLFLSYSFGIETINTSIHSRSSLENHTRFQTKMGKIYTRFRPKRRIIPTRWDVTYLYDLYKGVPPPPGSGKIEQNLDLVFANNSVQEAMPQIATMVAFLYFCCSSFVTSDNFSFYLLSRHSSSLTKIRKET